MAEDCGGIVKQIADSIFENMPEGTSFRTLVDFMHHIGPSEEFLLSADVAEAEIQRKTLEWAGINCVSEMLTEAEAKTSLSPHTHAQDKLFTR